MNNEIKDLTVQAYKAKQEYNAGLITREEAKARINPYLEAYNAKAVELAKKYNLKPKKISFAVYVR